MDIGLYDVNKRERKLRDMLGSGVHKSEANKNEAMNQQNTTRLYLE
jgi:hypothetical protein